MSVEDNRQIRWARWFSEKFLILDYWGLLSVVSKIGGFIPFRPVLHKGSKVFGVYFFRGKNFGVRTFIPKNYWNSNLLLSTRRSDTSIPLGQIQWLGRDSNSPPMALRANALTYWAIQTLDQCRYLNSCNALQLRALIFHRPPRFFFWNHRIWPHNAMIT